MASPTLAVNFALCVAIGVLQIVFLLLPTTAGARAPPLHAAAAHWLLPPATMTFFLAVTLNYVACAGNRPVPEVVERLTKITLGVALVTVALSLVMVMVVVVVDVVTFNTSGMA